MLRSALVALGVSAALGRPVLLVLRRLGALDVPNDRSSHVSPTPRGGGLAPAVGIVVAVLLSAQVVGAPRFALLMAVGAFGLIGLTEDLIGIPVAVRFGLQVAAALVATRWLFPDPSGTVLSNLLLGAGVVMWVLAYVNAYNFMDGIDGMSVAQALVAGGTWFLLGEARDVPELATGGAIVAAAAVGFAPYNLPRARMFLGDVGSYFLGASLATLAVLGLRAGLPPEAVLAPLVLYLADTGTTLARRAARGEAWYLPHRDHVYQRLTRLGLVTRAHDPGRQLLADRLCRAGHSQSRRRASAAGDRRCLPSRPPRCLRHPAFLGAEDDRSTTGSAQPGGGPVIHSPRALRGIGITRTG